MQSLLSETRGREKRGEGLFLVPQSCHDTEHYKHVESHVVSQDRCIFLPPISNRVSACVHASVHVKVCESTRTCLLVCTCRKVSGCGACVWGVNVLAPSHHLRGAIGGWQRLCDSKGVNWAVIVQEAGYDWTKRWDLLRFGARHSRHTWL